MKSIITIAIFFFIAIAQAALANTFLPRSSVQCVIDNAESYLSTELPFVIIVLDRCPDPGTIFDASENQLPSTSGIRGSRLEDPNILVFSRREFDCFLHTVQSLISEEKDLRLNLNNICGD